MDTLRRVYHAMCSGFESVATPAASMVDLYLRYHIALQFWMAGLMKIDSWQTTVFLFQSEYEVPFFSPTFAAVLGTGIELTMPLLLLLGVLGRFPALMLFTFNAIAVVSYPYLLTDGGRIGLNDHFYWGLILAVLMTRGPGKLTVMQLGHWLKNKALPYSSSPTPL